MCHHRVCRSCYKIFWPLEIELDCKKHLTLSWLQIASFLQAQGLNYLDAEELLQQYGPQWGVFRQPRQLQVDCEQFAAWVERSKSEIVAVIGKGGLGKSPAQIDQYLTSRGL